MCTECGSKGAEEAEGRAFRFWVMLSSMLERERRRKSGATGSQYELLIEGRTKKKNREDRPRNAVVLKQNCGVSFGCTDGCVMVSLGRPRLGRVEDVMEASEASAAGALLLVQNIPATVNAVANEEI
jgi:hypothetical protein